MRFLLDCGAFQGRDAVRKNAAPFPFDPQALDAIFLSHAHLDHCGRIPFLVRTGFRGPIHSTRATRDLAEAVMLDSAEVAREDHARWRRRPGRGPEPVPLFGEADVRRALGQFVAPADYGPRGEVHPGIGLTFIDAGHLLGSACVLVEIDEGGGRRLIFSGDIGNPGKPIVRDPATPPRADLAICEATYGGRDHRDMAATVAELGEVVLATIRRGGKVLVPSFALERTQELLFVLFDLWRETRLDGAPVFLDSPLAIDATAIFLRHRGLYDDHAAERLLADPNPFRFPALSTLRRSDESRRLNDLDGPAVIIAGSGMCTGGRILHHLRHHLPDPRSAVMIVGYQAEGLGRRLVERAPEVRIFGRRVPVRASVHTIGGFSAHGDRDDLLRWVRATAARRVSVVHGEPAMLEAFRATLAADGFDAVVPRPGERVAFPAAAP
jgi:metallo-beta-lactamase family protein